MKTGKKPFLDILGAGPAGLSAGYFAKNKNIPFRIFESSEYIGGNCRTITHGEFRYDTGAHRFHDKEIEATNVVKNLIGDELLTIDAPSQILSEGRMIDFPMNFSSLMDNLTISQIFKILVENIYNITSNKKKIQNFKELAYKTYGKTLSDRFLINYTEKLWGQSADNLDKVIAGGRLKNLDLISIIKHKLFGFDQHKNLDGSFYYPKYGFGSIFEAIVNYIDQKNIYLESNVSQIYHEGNRLTGLFCGNQKVLDPNFVISTLPIDVMIKIMNPMPPDDILKIAEGIRYRNLKVCVFFLDIPYFSKNASIYFPEKKYHFTRLYEPKNRSAEMAPRKRTCIIVESPYSNGDKLSTLDHNSFFTLVKNDLISLGLIKENKIISHNIFNMKNAYPILDVNQKEHRKKILSYLKRFDNLRLLGRNAKFQYLHTHDIILEAKVLIDKI